MKIAEMKFRLDFASPVYVDVFPAFALRSVLGLNLKRMHCVSHNTLCPECPFVATCAYAYMFESILPKGNDVLPGRDRASHPFRIEGPVLLGQTISQLEFGFQLFGRGVEYVPHVIYAFRIAGEKGLFRSRTPFEVHAFTGRGIPLDNGAKINLNRLEIRELTASEEVNLSQRYYLVECRTPVRFKTRGRYSFEFSARDFFEACRRRVETLFALYGDEKDKVQWDSSSRMGDSHVEIADRKLQWCDFTRYSSRQESVMKLGGVLGSFFIGGEAPENNWNMLEICASVGIGKNTSFGLGALEVREVSHGK
ncbi:MAG: CRISPR system precrRNA processing endoribonuclease RAMP protein Cas6 [Rectinema subterraneum]|uniref:CRISPR system precrRNA processing endoribonuclease RAMP protein Cas6 n=1 Tax=Rectinema subterraneum TaxID=2653714 RepID=UPI003C7A68C1